MSVILLWSVFKQKRLKNCNIDSNFIRNSVHCGKIINLSFIWKNIRLNIFEKTLVFSFNFRDRKNSKKQKQRANKKDDIKRYIRKFFVPADKFNYLKN